MTDPVAGIVPDIVMVECKNWDEVMGVVDKSQADGFCAILTVGGIILFRRKDTALSLFRELVQAYTNMFVEPGGIIPITAVQDERQHNAIAVAANTEQAIYLYGVTEQEFMDDIQNAEEFETAPHPTVN